MKARLTRIVDGVEVNEPDRVLEKGAVIGCPALSRSRIGIERVNANEGMIVLRLARQPVKPKAVATHFLVLDYVVEDYGVFVETDPVMVLPARKGAFLRDVVREET